ncbi:MAG: ATP-binding cassette domain-containing protein [Kibdelosporangium sp.]
MEIRAERVGVDGPHGPLLRPTSLSVRPGELALVTGEPGHGHTTLALALAGRIKPSHGAVTVDGRSDAAALRRQVALVDVPDVNAPEDGLRLVDAIGEELSNSSRKTTRQWLGERAAGEYANERVENVPARVRTRLLVEAAAARPGVTALMITEPDRHSSDPDSWWPSALHLAERGLAVVVLCAPPSARALNISPALLGRDDQPSPLTAFPGDPQ